VNVSPQAAPGSYGNCGCKLREMFRRAAKMAMKAVRRKAAEGLFDPAPPIPRESDS
jgi:hypothetical protein